MVSLLQHCMPSIRCPREAIAQSCSADLGPATPHCQAMTCRSLRDRPQLAARTQRAKEPHLILTLTVNRSTYRALIDLSPSIGDVLFKSASHIPPKHSPLAHFKSETRLTSLTTSVLPLPETTRDQSTQAISSKIRGLRACLLPTKEALSPEYHRRTAIRCTAR